MSKNVVMSSLDVFFSEGKIDYRTEKWKGHETCERFPVSIVMFNFEVSQWKKKVPIAPIFSNWFNFINFVSIKLFERCQRHIIFFEF